MRSSLQVLIGVVAVVATAVYFGHTPNIGKGGGLVCPQGDGASILPNSFPARKVIIGYYDHPLQDLLLEEILNITDQQSEIENVFVFVPKDSAGTLRDRFSKSFSFSKALFISSPNSEVTWLQDILEIATISKTGKENVLVLPYNEDAADLSVSIANLLKAGASKFSDDSIDEEGNDGDSGGNIEAISTKSLIVGDNISPEVKKFLEEQTQQKTLTVFTSWLQPGHVDELYAILPSPGAKTVCGKSLIYASPEVAMEILSGEPNSEKRELEVHDEFFSVQDEREDFRPCLEEIDWTLKTAKTPKCKSLLAANLHYQKLIEHDLGRIINRLKRDQPECSEISTLPLPVLFAPFAIANQYGVEADMGKAMNPNPVNGISLGNTFMLPGQPYERFKRHIEKALKGIGIKPSFVNTNHLHALQGGLHCAAQVVRECEPSK